MTRGRAYVWRGRAKIIPPDRKKTIRKRFHRLYFEKQKKDEALQIVSCITPTYLYRYCSAHLTSDTRGFSSLVSMIENKDFYVWFTSPHKFNDPYDSFISPDMSNLYSAFRPLVDYIPIFIERLFQILRQTSVPESNEELKKVLYPAILEALCNPPKEIDIPLSPEEVELCKIQSDYHLKNMLDSFNQSISDSISEQMGVACFSEEKSSLLMWSHYAENHAGYCLEYRTDDIIKAFDESVYGLFPITYTRKFDVLMGEYFDYLPIEDMEKELKKLVRTVSQKAGNMNELENFPEILVTPEVLSLINEFVSSCNSKLLQNEELMKHYLKRCCTKATEWKYEKEWRVIMRLPDGAADRNRTLSIMPTCIYLGAKTPEEEEKRVLAAVRKSGLDIQVKRMHMGIDMMRLDEKACF